MRKVYHSENSSVGLMVSFACSIGLTVLLFGALPFAHRIGRPDRGLILAKTTTTEIKEEEQKEEEKPQKQEEKPPEKIQEPDLKDNSQDIPLSADIEVGGGKGGGLLGFGAMDTASTVAATKIESYDQSDLEKRPEPISQVAPTYPRELERTKVEGSVVLVFLLNEEGRVEDPRVENSSRPEFERPALDAIRKWRFRPGIKDGQPVRTYIRQPLRFTVPSG